MDNPFAIDGKPLRVYLAGPMTGIDDYNFPAFNAAAEAWRAKGCTVVNPAELDAGVTTEPWAYYLRRDLVELMTCDAIAVLPGWRKSKGASLEVSVAEAVGIHAWDALAMKPLPHETILDEAARLVLGDRGKDYGPPAQDWARTAKIWSGILLDKLRDGQEITPQDALLCMIGVKMSREVNRPKRDNRVDTAGYALCLDLCQEQ